MGRRSSGTRIVRALIIPALAIAGLVLVIRWESGRPADSSMQEIRTVLVFVLDPTALEATASDEWARVVAALRAFYLRMPQKTEAIVFLVERGVMLRQPLRHRFPQQLDYDGPDRHLAALEGWFPEVERKLDDEWLFYHRPEQADRPTSCLLSSLNAAGALVEEEVKGAGETEVVLVVLSDLLEACDEVADINLEAGLDQLQQLASARVKLAAFDSVLLVQLPSEHYARPQDVDSIRDAWRRLLIGSGVKEEAIRIQSGFPGDLSFEAAVRRLDGVPRAPASAKSRPTCCALPVMASAAAPAWRSAPTAPPSP